MHRALSRLTRHRMRGLVLPLCLLTLFACRSVPLLDPPPVVSNLGAEKNRVAVLHGMGVHGWALDREGSGYLIARMDRRGTNTAVVRIDYDDASIAIGYLDSSNLRCSPAGAGRCETIHRAYNRWVVQLAKDIDQAARSTALIEALDGSAVSAPR